MTLAAHATVGAVAVATLPVHPVLAVAVAFVSHFILDALPHYDYAILSLDSKVSGNGTVRMVWGREFIFDILRIGLDALIGISLAWLVVQMSGSTISGTWIIIGAAAGMLPDFIQFLYGRIGTWPLGAIQKVHNYFHTESKLEDKPLIGIISQAALVTAILALVLI